MRTKREWAGKPYLTVVKIFCLKDHFGYVAKILKLVQQRNAYIKSDVDIIRYM